MDDRPPPGAYEKLGIAVNAFCAEVRAGALRAGEFEKVMKELNHHVYQKKREGIGKPPPGAFERMGIAVVTFREAVYDAYFADKTPIGKVTKHLDNWASGINRIVKKAFPSKRTRKE